MGYIVYMESIFSVGKPLVFLTTILRIVCIVTSFSSIWIEVGQQLRLTSDPCHSPGMNSVDKRKWSESTTVRVMPFSKVPKE